MQHNYLSCTGRCSRIQHIGQKWKDYVDVKPDVKMPPVPKCSQIDSSWIQLEMIWYICADLGNDGLLKFANGSKQTGIRSIIKDAQEKYYPVSEWQIYHWLSHYVKYGKVPEKTRWWKKEIKNQKQKSNGLDFTDSEG